MKCSSILLGVSLAINEMWFQQGWLEMVGMCWRTAKRLGASCVTGTDATLACLKIAVG